MECHLYSITDPSTRGPSCTLNSRIIFVVETFLLHGKTKEEAWGCTPYSWNESKSTPAEDSSSRDSATATGSIMAGTANIAQRRMGYVHEKLQEKLQNDPRKYREKRLWKLLQLQPLHFRQEQAARASHEDQQGQHYSNLAYSGTCTHPLI